MNKQARYYIRVKEDVYIDTEKKYIYTRHICKRVSFITDSVVIYYTYNREMCDRNVCLLSHYFFSLLYYAFISSEYFYQVYITEFPVIRYNNLRFKLDYHSNVFVKVDVYKSERSARVKLSLLKFQRYSSCGTQTGQFVNMGLALGLIKVRRYIKRVAEEIEMLDIFAVRSLGLYLPYKV